MPRLELKWPHTTLFFEAEQRGNEVLYATGRTDKSTSHKSTVHETEDDAAGALAKAIAGKLRSGYLHAGPSREIDGFEAQAPTRKGSALLIDVYFAAADPRFLDEIRAFDGAEKLGSLAKPWFEDPRPFARSSLIGYIDDGCNRPGHKALVKRLFKLAEGARDSELMAHFMVAFDRLNERPLVIVEHRWDPIEKRALPVRRPMNDPLVRERLDEGDKHPEFTRSTRRYLMRRAFRYFRRTGYRDSESYRRSVVAALELYRDEHLNTVGRLLRSWGLLHVLYGRSRVLVRAPNGIYVRAGETLAELVPAPIFSSAWDGAFADLMGLLVNARSRTVRAWALAMLRERNESELLALSIARVKELLLADNEEAQVLGVELLKRTQRLGELALSDWLELLGVSNIDVLGAVCDRVTGVIDGSRLGLAQCVDLALSPAAPLAALGLAWCKDKPIGAVPDLEQVLRLGRAKVAAVRADAAKYCAGLVAQLSFARPEHARELCDSAHVEVRAAALLVVGERFGDRIELWSALTESPYPDVRSFVVIRAKALEKLSQEPLRRLFATVLLAVHGASKDKRRVLGQIVERITRAPSEAPELLPLFATLLGSVHAAERSVALAALARAAFGSDSVRELTRARFPELVIASQVSR